MNEILKKIKDLLNFSIPEIVIIIFIVGLITAVALPYYQSSLSKCQLSEADANLGSIRTQLRVYSSTHGTYPITNPAGYVVGADWNELQHGDISGKYFPDSAYTYLCTDGSNFTISCSPGSILKSPRTLNQAGRLAGGS